MKKYKTFYEIHGREPSGEEVYKMMATPPSYKTTSDPRLMVTDDGRVDLGSHIIPELIATEDGVVIGKPSTVPREEIEKHWWAEIKDNER